MEILLTYQGGSWDEPHNGNKDFTYFDEDWSYPVVKIKEAKEKVDNKNNPVLICDERIYNCLESHKGHTDYNKYTMNTKSLEEVLKVKKIKTKDTENKIIIYYEEQNTAVEFCNVLSCTQESYKKYKAMKPKVKNVHKHLDKDKVLKTGIDYETNEKFYILKGEPNKKLFSYIEFVTEVIEEKE